MLTLTPRGGSSRQHLVYTHGGSYVHPLVLEHWWIIDRATRGTGVTVTVPLYRLAPEGEVEQAYTFLQAVYAALVEESGSASITLAGDSAGGALAIGQAIRYRDSATPAPRQVIALAPWVDLTLSHPSVPSLQRIDPMLRIDEALAFGRLWARGRDPRAPSLSPLFGDLAGLPPVHVFQGGRDLLAADAHLLAGALQQVGNPGVFTFAPDAFHVYPGAFWTPEARTALRGINQLLRPPTPS